MILAQQERMQALGLTLEDDGKPAAHDVANDAGEWFADLEASAASAGVSKVTIWRAINYGKRVNGKQWRWATTRDRKDGNGLGVAAEQR